MKTGLVSIITPAYNAERFIGETIESVLNQSYQNWEMLIVDDGSKDKTEIVVKEYEKKDNRIRLIKQANAGSGAARNNGIRRAEGNYICLLDADDTWNENFLEEQIKLIKLKDATLVFSSHSRINESGEKILKPHIVPEKIEYTDLLKTCSISCLTAMYDTTKFGKFYLREDLKSLRDDYVLWLEIIKKCKVAYGNKQDLGNYRVMQSSTSGNKKKVIKPQYLVYRQVEKLGILKSSYYLTHWAYNGWKKYKV
ncbi:glycosyltransferase family 2 protein [Cetobacterium sp.]|uniref:glycosyltransferase family 2 protein n=1 Tax=Cetobacterium sp. TaxID=2071632 RepID=UPI003F393A61